MSTDPKVGDQSACASCGNDIVFIGPYWDHVGELKPRHPAWPSVPSEKSGLTPQEQEVMDALVSAWNKYKNLPGASFPNEQSDFIQAIHQAQSVLQSRIIRRLYPEYWR
jgi:hypothetical protein